MQLPLGRLEHSISECPPSKHSCHAGRSPSHRERPCTGSFVSRPCGHGLQVTTARKPDIWVKEPPDDPGPRPEAPAAFGIFPTEAPDKCRVETSPPYPVRILPTKFVSITTWLLIVYYVAIDKWTITLVKLASFQVRFRHGTSTSSTSNKIIIVIIFCFR